MAIINLPPKLNELLNKESKDNKNNSLATIVQNNFVPFRHILEKSDLYFFPDYTDHSIHHIEDVLLSIENLITDNTIDLLSPTDIGVLVTAVVLHDIGMHTSAEMFKNIISGKYDNITDNWFKNEKTWKELWEDYLKESQYWNVATKISITGDPIYNFRITNKGIEEETDENSITYKISHPLYYDERDKRFVGEFIRRHHGRLAYEVALNGYIGNKTYRFENYGLPRHFMQLAGLIARSHSMNIRDTFDILKKKIGDASWKKPDNIKVVLLMILVRIADLLQINPERTDEIMLNLRTIYSPFSIHEHEMHLSIDCIQIDNDDPELIVVQATPNNAQMYVKIESVLHYIQHEFDLSWAILGEVYGNRYQLRYRRIITNISDEEVKKEYGYVPKLFGFKYNNSLLELLIAPLYGDNPSYGVRELVQNAVDACRTRMALDKEYNAKENFTHVTVSLDSQTKLFRIVDTGIGMSIEEVEKYFLTIGSSYSSSIDWKKTRDDVNKKANNDFNLIYRTGRFGIGILAAFLIGPEIKVKTKSIKSKPGDNGFQFTLRGDKNFIQIDRIDLPDFGTTIEIKCNDETIELLKGPYRLRHSLGSNDWFGWYIDSKPRVDYFYNESLVSLYFDDFKWYKPLPTMSTDFTNIYWRPEILFNNIPIYRISDSKPYLFCNGFFITNHSNKKTFSVPGFEKYIPQVIPDLIITDIYNQIPLNLTRNNTNRLIKYSFEKDLAIARYKDLLCQLLAIEDMASFKYKHHFFHNQLGYTVNKYWASPHEGGDRFSVYRSIKEYLPGNKLVHVLYGVRDRIIWDFWEQFMSKHPEVTFIFNTVIYEKSMFSTLTSGDLPHKLKEYSSAIRVSVYLDNHIHYSPLVWGQGENFNKEAINQELELISNNQRICGEYVFLQKKPSDEIILADLVTQLQNSSIDSIPYGVVIHSINFDNNLSYFDDFFKEYAGGNMIVPYDKTERRKKFAKLYAECGEEIEQYRNIYNNPKFREPK